MSTLVVEYLPGYPISHARVLLDHLLTRLPAREEVRRHDLLIDPAPIFTAESLRAYVKRDMMGEAIDDAERALLRPADRLIADVLATDVLVLAFPLHNFSVPAAIKAYFDAIMFNNSTFRVGPAPGQYAGLMTAKKALVLSAAGGVYDAPPFDTMNFMTPLVETEFRFMGFDATEVVLAEGMVRPPEEKAASLARAVHRVTEVAGRWYDSAASAERIDA
ncbi:FMN-dependent NADH-azoreductase [Brevundimonas sp.]|uniref:FMN-dependent NADH-azoreductase n=1 Tax=Brevundimonas sp. TaxID=1871086 RepID=UPI002E14DD51|nr:NAD(P)H-dependent oxidoreductase [Brevundimonas sp.]